MGEYPTDLRRVCLCHATEQRKGRLSATVSWSCFFFVSLSAKTIGKDAFPVIVVMVIDIMA